MDGADSRKIELSGVPCRTLNGVAAARTTREERQKQHRARHTHKAVFQSPQAIAMDGTSSLEESRLTVTDAVHAELKRPTTVRTAIHPLFE